MYWGGGGGALSCQHMVLKHVLYYRFFLFSCLSDFLSVYLFICTSLILIVFCFGFFNRNYFARMDSLSLFSPNVVLALSTDVFIFLWTLLLGEDLPKVSWTNQWERSSHPDHPVHVIMPTETGSGSGFIRNQDLVLQL